MLGSWPGILGGAISCREAVQGRELIPDRGSDSMWLRQMGP